LWALLAQVFLPWDDPIRLAFGWPGGGAAHMKLLPPSAAAPSRLSARLGGFRQRPGGTPSPPRVIAAKAG
jgi:hypothetical protein